MIAGCGVDIVLIERLRSWGHFSDERLKRIFTDEELLLLRQNGIWSAQRAATFFAFKEAFYKALSVALVETGALKREIFFQQIAPLVTVRKNSWGIPGLVVDWHKIEVLSGMATCQWSVQVSCAHESTHVVAFVILSQMRYS